MAGDPAAADMVSDVAPVNGRVGPNGAGMSVALDTPMNLPRYRRPPQFGLGTGRHPIFALPVHAVPVALELHSDSPTHAVLQSATWVHLEVYEKTLEGTQPYWMEILK